MSDYRPRTISGEYWPLVCVFTAPNPGPKTLEGTRTYLLLDEQCYIIDPGPDIPEYQQAIAAYVGVGGRARADGILLTHGHPDHAPGAALLSSLINAPIYASPRLDRRFLPSDLAIRPVGEGHQFGLGRQVLHTLSAPGHSHDHLAFWLESAGMLFAGDTVLGRGTSLVAPPEGNMRLYMETLARFQALEPRVICPGHGPIITDPTGKLAEYIQHRTERERQVLDALQDGPATPRDLVERLYADVDPHLRGLAEGSVCAQLQKLREEGRVVSRGGSYSLS